MKKRLFLLIILLSLLPNLNMWAADGDTFTFSVDKLELPFRVISEDEKTCELTSSSFLSWDGGNMALTIPEEVKGYKVVKIGNNALWSYWFLTSIIVPEGVTTIEDDALGGMANLISISLPSTLTQFSSRAIIANDALMTITVASDNKVYDSRDNCNAVIETATNKLVAGCKNSTFPKTVTSIGEQAFRSCRTLTSFSIPEGITSIERLAFWECKNLESIHIPASVIDIGSDFIAGCNKLTMIDVASSNPKYDSRDNCNAIIRTETNTLSFGCTGTVIPSSVKEIGYRAFYDCDMESVKIPEGVTKISNWAFMHCDHLLSITIPSSATEIANSIAISCKKLVTITVDSDNPRYDSRENCNAIVDKETNTIVQGCLGTTFPSTVTTIGRESFRCCTYGLVTVTIPENITTIEAHAFWECRDLTKVTFPETVIVVASDAFESTPWYNYKTNGVVYAGNCAFSYKGTMPNNCTIQLKEGTTSVGNNAFSNQKNLKTITFPSGIKRIGSSAFSSCSNITSLSLPEGIIEIGNEAFYGCSGITDVSLPESLTHVGHFAFLGTSISSVVIPSGVISVGVRSFPSSVNSIEVSADNSVYDSREHCNAILETASNKLIFGCQNTIVPASTTSIGEQAFALCSGLTSINLPEGLMEIGVSAFASYGITSVSIPASVNTIKNAAFSGSSITSISVAKGNTTYDSRNNCNAIIETASNTLIIGCRNSVIPSDIKAIGSYAFFSVKEITSLSLPEGLESIGENAFRNSGLASVSIPSTVKEIGKQAFEYCTNLKEVTSYIQEPFEIEGDVFITDYSYIRGGYQYYYQYYYPSILNVPPGTKDKYLATDSWNVFETITEMVGKTVGDTNGNGIIDAEDINEIRNYIFGKPSSEFNMLNADVNNDGKINVTDIVKLVELIKE